jgi:hypothetical protein
MLAVNRSDAGGEPLRETRVFHPEYDDRAGCEQRHADEGDQLDAAPVIVWNDCLPDERRSNQQQGALFIAGCKARKRRTRHA